MATRYSQPQSGARLNLANPLVKKLRYLSTLGGNSLDLVSGDRQVQNNTPNIATKVGVARNFVTANSNVITLPTGNIVSGYPLTVACWANTTPTSAGAVLYSLNGTNYSAILGYPNSAGYLIPNVTCDVSFIHSKVAPVSTLMYLVAVHRSGSWDLYINGVLATNTTAPNSAWGEPAAGNHHVGARIGGASLRYNNGTVSDLAVFQGELSVDEIENLSANPYQLYATSSRVLWLPSVGGGTSTGSLAATDTTDSFAGSGTTPTSSGPLAATDASDSLAASGTSPVPGLSGSLDATESVADTAAFAGASAVSGSLSATDSTDTMVGSGTLTVSGALAATDAADTLTASGTLPTSTGTLASTDADDSFAGTGALQAQGALAATESTDSFGSAGNVQATGALAATDASDSFGSTGYSTAPTSIGSLAATDAGDSFEGLGNLPSSVGTFDATETGADSATFAGASAVSGSWSATDSADSFASLGNLTSSGSLASIEDGADTMAAFGGVPTSTGALAATDSGDSFAGAASLIATGALAATETDDTVYISGTVPIVSGGSFYAVEEADTAQFAGEALIQGMFSAAEAGLDFMSFYGVPVGIEFDPRFVVTPRARAWGGRTNRGFSTATPARKFTTTE